jgi:hypothetical protein
MALLCPQKYNKTRVLREISESFQTDIKLLMCTLHQNATHILAQNEEKQ